MIKNNWANGDLIDASAMNAVATAVNDVTETAQAAAAAVNDVSETVQASGIADAKAKGIEIVQSATVGDVLNALGASLSGVAVLTGTAEEARNAINATSSDDVVAIILTSSVVSDAVTANIAGRDLLEASSPRVMQIVATADVWALVDMANRQAITVYDDGTTRIWKLSADSIPDGSLTPSKLTADFRAGVAQAMPLADPYVWALVDQNNRVAVGVLPDGSLDSKLPTATPSDVVLPEISGTTPNRKLWALDHASGSRTLITDSDDPHNPSVVNGAILYSTSAGERCWTPSDGVMPTYPDRSVIACWGDSLTQIGGWSEQLDALLPAAVVNLGGSGQTAEEIAIRQGGITLTVTVAGGSIPASGSVSVSSSQDILSIGAAWSQTGTLAGVPGTLSKALNSPWTAATFTRTTSGAAVSVSGPVAFVSDAARTYESCIHLIMAGRNDLNAVVAGDATINLRQRVLTTYQAMVARMKAFHREFLCLGTISASDGVDTSNGAKFQAINSTLALNFGPRFVDCHTYMSQQVIYDLGITPTSADLAAMAVLAVPPSIMNPAAPGHFSAAAGALLATNIIKPRLDSMGWTA